MVTDATLHLSIPVADLAAARQFYEGDLGCRVGRERSTWIDVWFFDMQITLHEEPSQVLPAGQQGVRHFGVVLHEAREFDALIERLRETDTVWLSEPQDHTEAELSGKRAAKIADPSGNVIEIKYYPDVEELMKPVG